MSLCITSCDKKRIKQIFESTHIWFKWRYFARTEKWEVRGERKRREDRLVTQKLSNPLVMSSLTYPYLDRKGSFHGCFEVINPYLNVVSIMNYQTKRGGKALIYSFLLQLCMMCFHWRLWKVFHHASHPEVVKGQNQKELTLSFLPRGSNSLPINGHRARPLKQRGQWKG